MTANAFSIRRQIGVHLFKLGEDLTSVAQQRLAGARQGDTARLTQQQRRANVLFEEAYTVTGGRGRQVRPLGAAGQILRFGDGQEEPEIGEVVMDWLCLERTVACQYTNC